MARKSTNGQSQSTTLSTSTKVEKQHLTILSKHKHYYDFYMRTGEVVNFWHHVQEEILNAYKVEFPHYHYQRTCPVCVAEFLVRVYTWYEKQIQ